MNHVTVSLQEKNGVFQAVLHYKDIKTNKKTYKWKTTGIKIIKGKKKELRKQAEQIAEQIRSEFEKSLNIDIAEPNSVDCRKEQLFAEYMLEWLESITNTKAPSTFGGYQSNIQAIICPYFENKCPQPTVCTLTTIDIQDFIDTQYKLGKSPTTVKHYYNNIHQALDKLTSIGVLNINPANGCKLEKPQQYIPKIYNQQELKQFLIKIRGSNIEIPVILAAYYRF